MNHFGGQQGKQCICTRRRVHAARQEGPGRSHSQACSRGEAVPPPPELELDSPAIYVDSVPAIANPCYPNGSLDMTPSNGGPGCNVFVFHHLYIDNNWKAILEDQVSKLIFSGLYDRAEAVFQLYRGATPRTWRRQCSFCIASAANSAF